jgi:hypothetical protein
MKEENALDFFMRELGLTKEGKVETTRNGIIKISDAYDIAMEVYKQQIIDAHIEGQLMFNNADKYYNKTFK